MYRIRSGFLTLAATASMLLWASIAVTPVTAAPVSFNFTGTLNDPNDFYLTLTGNTPAFSGGEAVSGTITRGGPISLDRMFHFLSGASRYSTYAAVRRVGRVSK